MWSRLVLLCAAGARAADVFQYGAFTQTATYSIANQLGFFAAYDLDVVYNQVASSTAAYASLLSGEYDLLTGTIDNAVNLRFNSGENFTVVGQLDQGPDLVLAAAPGITEISQLAGKPLIVDSPVSGYAYLLRKILSANGLAEDEYFFQTVGGTSLRYADLVSGALPNGSTVYGTILTYPFTAEGEVLPTSQRPNILARVSSVEEPISSSAFTIVRSSIDDCAKADLIMRFLAAMWAANLYLNDFLSKDCATKAIQAQLNVTAATAALEYTAATNSVTGEVSAGIFEVNQLGLNNIIAVRQEFGGFSVPATFDFAAATAPGPGKLIDYTLRDEALLLLKPELLFTGC